MIKSWHKRLILVIIIFCMMVGFIPQQMVYADKDSYNSQHIARLMEGIIDWKKQSNGLDISEDLFNNSVLDDVGTPIYDWYAISIGRIGYKDDYEGYLSLIYDKVCKAYLNKDKLDPVRATEWHRIGLTILSLGGDPTSIIDDKGNIINLIEDGTYNRGKIAELGAQGINGFVWGLITMDAMRYKVPDNAHDNREIIIKQILQQQLSDNGFALSEGEADTDITAMVIYALAPYYNSEEIYNYELNYSKESVSKSVRQVIDEALECLSKKQLSTGGFDSWGTESAESIAQVIVALCSLGIDPYTDARFIKEGNSVIDGLMNFKMADGGFIHSIIFDEENPSSKPDKSNSMASEQALYALVSLYRYKSNYRSLYDFRESWDEGTKTQLEKVRKFIEDLDDDYSSNDISVVEDVFNEYKQIPIDERCYVYNYYKLSEIMKVLDIKNDSEYIDEYMDLNTGGNGYLYDVINDSQWSSEIEFTEKDIDTLRNLPKELSTKEYSVIVNLSNKLEKNKNIENYDKFKVEIEEKKSYIEAIQKKIDLLNEAIINKLYPFEDISLRDRENVDDIMKRYEELTEYDKEKIVRYDDVVRAKTQINNIIRNYMVFTGVSSVIIVLLIIVYKNGKERKQKKLHNSMMDEVSEEDE